jgi:archaeal preflagellin peptidase FlaK
MNLLLLPLIIACFVFLIYYGYRDLKCREINIFPLILFCIFSIIYLGIFIFKNNMLLWKMYIFQITICFIFVLIIYFIGRLSSFAYIGEGDLYIILMIAFSCGFGVLLPEIIFLISLFLMLLIPIYLFIKNLFSKNIPKYSFFKSIIIMLLGTFKNIDKINDFYTPLETLKIKNNKLIRNINLKPNFDSEKELESIRKIAKLKNIKKIWVSPLVPFIIPIIISYVITIILFINKIFINYGIFMIPYI